MENIPEQQVLQVSPHNGQTDTGQNAQGQTEQVPQKAQVSPKERRTPGKWRTAEKRRAELEERLNVIKDKERRQRNSLLIQTGLLFINVLEMASQGQRDKFYNILMESTPEGQQERAHNVFSWAEETALKRLAQKGVSGK